MDQNQKRKRTLCGSRRTFLGGIVAGGIIAVAPLLKVIRASSQPTPRDGPMTYAMAGGDIEACREACYAAYELCCQGCKRFRSRARRAICYAACAEQLAACYAACEAARVGRVLDDAADWIADHPGVVVGTIVAIGGVTFIVVSGGSGLALAPVLAL